MADDDAGDAGAVPRSTPSAIGRAPVSQKTTLTTTMMRAKFVLNRITAPRPASSQRPSSRQIPTVASGGTSETAMATPGRASLPVCRAATQAPAAPAARATPQVEEDRARCRASSAGVSDKQVRE